MYHKSQNDLRIFNLGDRFGYWIWKWCVTESTDVISIWCIGNQIHLKWTFECIMHKMRTVDWLVFSPLSFSLFTLFWFSHLAFESSHIKLFIFITERPKIEHWRRIMPNVKNTKRKKFTSFYTHDVYQFNKQDAHTTDRTVLCLIRIGNILKLTAISVLRIEILFSFQMLNYLLLQHKQTNRQANQCETFQGETNQFFFKIHFALL